MRFESHGFVATEKKAESLTRHRAGAGLPPPADGAGEAIEVDQLDDRTP
jgi:hypothetical protein